jgi:fatty-acid peroxygenase
MPRLLRGRPVLDETLSLLLRGYGYLPDRRRSGGGRVAVVRLLGRPMVALRGPDAVSFFYDEENVRRAGAVPEPVRATLFGKGAVHGLDGQNHLLRKAMFVGLLADERRVATLVDHVGEAWDLAAETWPRRKDVVLFAEASRIVTRGVCRWACLPLPEAQVGPLAGDLVAMVDGFATLGPRHWRARRARKRQEARLAQLVERVPGAVGVSSGSVLDEVSHHQDNTGRLLGPRVAAVER